MQWLFGKPHLIREAAGSSITASVQASCWNETQSCTFMLGSRKFLLWRGVDQRSIQIFQSNLRKCAKLWKNKREQKPSANPPFLTIWVQLRFFFFFFCLHYSVLLWWWKLINKKMDHLCVASGYKFSNWTVHFKLPNNKNLLLLQKSGNKQDLPWNSFMLYSR